MMVVNENNARIWEALTECMALCERHHLMLPTAFGTGAGPLPTEQVQFAHLA